MEGTWADMVNGPRHKKKKKKFHQKNTSRHLANRDHYPRTHGRGGARNIIGEGKTRKAKAWMEELCWGRGARKGGRKDGVGHIHTKQNVEGQRKKGLPPKFQ